MSMSEFWGSWLNKALCNQYVNKNSERSEFWPGNCCQRQLLWPIHGIRVTQRRKSPQFAENFCVKGQESVGLRKL